jgi:D-threonate/D-erythronate kinase
VTRGFRTVALIADDLTGACDAALQFTLHGAATVVYLSPTPPSMETYEVTAVNTSSRNLSAEAACERVREAAQSLTIRGSEILFKKIDSTMRGNVGVEAVTAREALGCECAVVTPAFPRMGRVVRDGMLYVDGDGDRNPIDVIKAIRSEGVDDCIHVPCREITAAIEGGHRLISTDATTEGDLDAIAAAAIPLGNRILYVGSAGLAHAVAETQLPCHLKPVISRSRSKLPCAVLIGSDHPVVRSQLQELTRARKGQHMLFNIELGLTQRDAILDIVKNRGPFAALFLSGGDTAALVLDALGAQAIEIVGQVVAGLPWGILRGGPFDGLSIATKSGGFGDPDDLIKVTDFFTCLNNN